jgi:hypothetical protein
MRIKKFNYNFVDGIKNIYESFKDFLSHYDLSDIPLKQDIHQIYIFHFQYGKTSYQIDFSEMDHNSNLGELKLYFDPDDLDGESSEEFFNSAFLNGIKQNDGIESISKIQDLIYKIEIGINTPPYKGSNDCKIVQDEIKKWIQLNYPFMEIRETGGYLFFSFTPNDVD